MLLVLLAFVCYYLESHDPKERGFMLNTGATYLCM